MSLYSLIRPVFFCMDAERAHYIAIKLLKTGMIPAVSPVCDPALQLTLCGMSFPNPVGLAAGFDKNAEVIAPILSLGFGFTEVGTVTPQPQDGNPKPRIFRDLVHESVINRMGFPGVGLAVFKNNLQNFLKQTPRPDGVIGINIGMNKNQTNPADDYGLLVRELAPLADYLTINISSPNTPGLRDLQDPVYLKGLLHDVLQERACACPQNPPPLFLKLAPDLDEKQQQAIAKTVMDCQVDGLILTNTTLDRPDILPPSFAGQQGGLSGKALKDKATEVIRNFYQFTDGQIPIIGLGGISSGADAYEKIKAGATLVQLYTALVFQGPAVVRQINNDILRLLQKEGYSHIGEAIGADYKNAKKYAKNRSS